MPASKHLFIFFLAFVSARAGYSQISDTGLAPLKIEKDPDYVQFSVDNVLSDTTRLRTDDYEKIVTFKLQGHATPVQRPEIRKLLNQPYSPPKEQLTTLCIATKQFPLVESHSNALVETLAFAYAHHKPVSLSPDVIWLTIMQGLAIHIQQNSEALRNKIVDFQGEKNLDVKVGPDFDKHAIVQWQKVITNFRCQIKDNIGADLAKITDCRFSTTNSAEQIALSIGLMNTMSPYFTYSMTIMCGIPEIRLEGTVEDWKRIRSLLNELRKYNLDWWINSLATIIDEFVLARQEVVHQKFWSEIFKVKYKDVVCASIPYPNGWILQLFPYTLSDGSYIKNPVLTAIQHNTTPDSLGISYSNLPEGISKTDLLVVNTNDDTYKICYLYAGLVGIHQNEKNGVLKPEISWAVVETDKKPSTEIIENYKKTKN